VKKSISHEYPPRRNSSFPQCIPSSRAPRWLPRTHINGIHDFRNVCHRVGAPLVGDLHVWQCISMWSVVTITYMAGNHQGCPSTTIVIGFVAVILCSLGVTKMA